MGPIATEEENGVSELKWQHVRQWNEVAKLGKRWQLDTRKAQECLLIQLYFFCFLDEFHNEEVRRKLVQNYDRGTESTKKQGNRLEFTPSPASQQTAPYSRELSQAAVLPQRHRKRSRPRVANAAVFKPTSASL